MVILRVFILLFFWFMVGFFCSFERFKWFQADLSGFAVGLW